MRTTFNVSGIKNGRTGRYKGDVYKFTHRNPANGKIWSDDIPVGKNEFGKWVSPDEVEFLD